MFFHNFTRFIFVIVIKYIFSAFVLLDALCYIFPNNVTFTYSSYFGAMALHLIYYGWFHVEYVMEPIEPKE